MEGFQRHIVIYLLQQQQQLFYLALPLNGGHLVGQHEGLHLELPALGLPDNDLSCRTRNASCCMIIWRNLEEMGRHRYVGLPNHLQEDFTFLAGD